MSDETDPKNYPAVDQSIDADGINQPSIASDVVDFYLKWKQFRDVAIDLSNNPELHSVEKEVIGWLVKLADRVSKHDLITTDKSIKNEQ